VGPPPAHPWHPVLNYNYPGWSISVELFFYFSFPFLASWFYSRYGFKKVFATALGFWALCQVLFTFMHFRLEQNPSESLHNFLYYNPINHLNEFVLGSAAAMFLKNKYAKWKGNYDLLLLVFTAFTVLYLSLDKASWNLFDHNGLLAVLFLPIIILLSLNTGLITKLFNNKGLVLLGEISFGVYILAEPVLGAMNRLFASYSIQHFPFSIMLLTLVFVCYLVYISFEKPLQQMIKKTLAPGKDQEIETRQENIPAPVKLQPGMELTCVSSKTGESSIELS
jgi:peptidoglycan/LPS O-acetylase OafA/YrhL